MKLKIPNILTIGRIIIVPIFVITFFLPGMYGDLIPFFLFIAASFTDFLDGLLARVLKAESKLGELLDPIADKILIVFFDQWTIDNHESTRAWLHRRESNLPHALRSAVLASWISPSSDQNLQLLYYMKIWCMPPLHQTTSKDP